MNLLKAILFGIIEGITEWMPISSTAHMKILNVFLPLDVSPEFYEFYNLGLGDPIAVSSVHGHGTGDLLDAVIEHIAPEEFDDDELMEEEEETVAVAENTFKADFTQNVTVAPAPAKKERNVSLSSLPQLQVVLVKPERFEEVRQKNYCHTFQRTVQRHQLQESICLL